MDREGQRVADTLELSGDDEFILQHIKRRVLWLTTYLLHYINKLRPSSDDLKVCKPIRTAPKTRMA